MKKLADGGYAIGFLNRDDEKSRTISLPVERFRTREVKVRDLWSHKDIGVFEEEISFDVKPHECRLIKVSVQ